MALNIPCRFTERYLEVRPHGHGVKLSIDQPDGRISVFLTHDDMLALTRELVDIENDDAPLSLEDKPRNKPAEHLETVLSDLETAIRVARQRLIRG